MGQNHLSEQYWDLTLDPPGSARGCEIEQREVRVWALPAGSGVQPWHDHFLSLLEVRRGTEVFDTAKRRFIARAQAPAYYLSTLSGTQVPAREFAHLVRQHWATRKPAASRARYRPGRGCQPHPPQSRRLRLPAPLRAQPAARQRRAQHLPGLVAQRAVA